MSRYASGLLKSIDSPSENDLLKIVKFNSSDISSIEKLRQDRKTFHEAYLNGRTLSLKWRANQLQNLRQAILENQKELCHAASLDFKDAQTANQEVFQVINELEEALESLEQWSKPKKVGSPWAFAGSKASIQPEPLGAVLMIAPWNFPIVLSFGPVIGAIAAGNCVVLKPSEMTPNVSAVMEDMFNRYMDSDCFRVYNGGVDVATELLKQKWDHIFYTGNGAVGKVVMRAAAEHLTPVTLELGGKSPAIVDLDTININHFVRRLFFGKLTNSGQVCIAIDYILCLPQHVEPIVNAFKQAILEHFGPDPLKSPHLGRIVNERHVQRILDLLPEKKKGVDGEIAFGGRYNLADRRIEPTIIVNPDPYKAKVMKDEIFGPILPIIGMESYKACFDYIRSKDKPLASYLFTSDSRLITKYKAEITSGSQVINDSLMQFAHPHLPFGGVGPSGMGAYHGKASFDLFSHHKSILEKNWALTAIDKFLVPPVPYEFINPVIFPRTLRASNYNQFFHIRWIQSLFMTFQWIGLFNYLLFKALTQKSQKH